MELKPNPRNHGPPMDSSPSSPSSEHQHPEIDPSSSPNFDPIEVGLIDLDHLCLSMTSDPDFLNHLLPGSFELGGHQDSTLVEDFIDHKMEKVSLADSSMHPNYDDCNKTQVVEATTDVGNNTVTVSNGVVVGEEKNDPINEVSAVNDPIIAVNDSNEGESSDELEENGDSSVKSSSSSSSSSSLSNEEDEESSSGEEEHDGNEKEEEELPVEVKEAEIEEDALEEAIFGSDGEEVVTKGPIKSKHEIEDLPPVPPLEVSLEPHHQTLPVGIVSSVLGNRVIVQGSEKHSPLNEGSILWITETRLPLGRIDEIFGPVKNPYYIVRYNSDKEVPQGINAGATVSFVPDFANHILNEKYLYEKGYDASGVDDEEVVDEMEFSDDEKEAEYKRFLQQKKRDTNDGGNQESGFHKKNSNFKRSGFHKDKQRHPPHPRSSQPGGHLHEHQAPVNVGWNNFNSAPRPHPTSIQGGFPPPPQPQSMGMQGGSFHQNQMMAMQGGLPLNWMPAQHQNQPLNNLVNGIMQYQQQLVPNVGALPGNLPWFGGGGAYNPSVDLSLALVGLMAQGGFAQGPLGVDNVNQSAHGQASQVINQGKPGQIERYSVNLQGFSAMNDNGQSHGQALPVVDRGGFGQVPVVNQGGGFSQMQSGYGNSNPEGQVSGVSSQGVTISPDARLKQWRSSSGGRGKKLYGRGGGRHSFGRGGGSEM